MEPILKILFLEIDDEEMENVNEPRELEINVFNDCNNGTSR
jgi:hypothetical protein